MYNKYHRDRKDEKKKSTKKKEERGGKKLMVKRRLFKNLIYIFKCFRGKRTSWGEKN